MNCHQIVVDATLKRSGPKYEANKIEVVSFATLSKPRSNLGQELYKIERFSIRSNLHKSKTRTRVRNLETRFGLELKIMIKNRVQLVLTTVRNYIL